jgi:FixJ family two-component response regulator
MRNQDMDHNLIPWSGSYQAVKPAKEIFVVDDEEDMRDILTSILSLEGLRVTALPDGEALLKQPREKTPVCVFLDIVMPGRSGIQILQELNLRKFKAPVFLMSARNDTPTVVEGIKYGALDFLTKPFDPYDAVRRVRGAVELWNNRKETGISEIEAKPIHDHVRLTNRETEVLAQVLRGASSKEIAKSIGITKRTVDFFRMAILRKLGARNTSELARIVARWG